MYVRVSLPQKVLSVILWILTLGGDRSESFSG